MIQRTWIEWADRLYNWRLNEAAASLLEVAGPLNFLGAQIVYFGQPLITTFTTPEKAQALAELLENPTETQAFIEVLRTYPLSSQDSGSLGTYEVEKTLDGDTLGKH